MLHPPTGSPPSGQREDDAGGLAPVLEGLAARHLHRLSHRAMPAGGAEIGTFLSYAAERS
jgi:hypothetical protein